MERKYRKPTSIMEKMFALSEIGELNILEPGKTPDGVWNLDFKSKELDITFVLSNYELPSLLNSAIGAYNNFVKERFFIEIDDANESLFPAVPSAESANIRPASENEVPAKIDKTSEESAEHSTESERPFDSESFFDEPYSNEEYGNTDEENGLDDLDMEASEQIELTNDAFVPEDDELAAIEAGSGIDDVLSEEDESKEEMSNFFTEETSNGEPSSTEWNFFEEFGFWAKIEDSKIYVDPSLENGERSGMAVLLEGSVDARFLESINEAFGTDFSKEELITVGYVVVVEFADSLPRVACGVVTKDVAEALVDKLNDNTEEVLSLLPDADIDNIISIDIHPA